MKFLSAAVLAIAMFAGTASAQECKSGKCYKPVRNAAGWVQENKPVRKAVRKTTCYKPVTKVRGVLVRPFARLRCLWR